MLNTIFQSFRLSNFRQKDLPFGHHSTRPAWNTIIHETTLVEQHARSIPGEFHQIWTSSLELKGKVDDGRRTTHVGHRALQKSSP